MAELNGRGTVAEGHGDLWYRDAVFYEIPVRSFFDSNGDGFGDLEGVTEKLEYLRDLGVDCIWLLPMFPSPLRDDGYDISDFTSIHPDIGSVDHLKSLIDEAHRLGLRVIADLVLNHTSDQHPWFQEARQDPDSPYRDYYVWTDDPGDYADARIIFIDTEKSNWTYDDVAGQYFWHRFFSHQPDLNYATRQVWQEMFEIIRFWLDVGLDGFRCDAVPYLYEREGTNCENLPETHAFLAALRRMVDTEYPGKILLAEANQWPEDVIPYFGSQEHPEFHLCFHFPAMPRVFLALKRQDQSPIVDIIRRTPPIPDTCQWATFLRNHDELTLEMVTIDERHFMWDQYAQEARMRLNLGIRRRLAPLLENCQARLELAFAILLTLPGSPCIYYGDEIGMGDDIWQDDRNGVRTPMQWSGMPHGGFTTGDRTWIPVIDNDEFGFSRVNVDDQLQRSDSFLNWMKSILSLRKSHPALSRGELEFVSLQDPAVLSYVRYYHDDAVLFVANLSDQEHSITIPLNHSTNVLSHIFGPIEAPASRDPRDEYTLPPLGYAMFELASARSDVMSVVT